MGDPCFAQKGNTFCAALSALPRLSPNLPSLTNVGLA